MPLRDSAVEALRHAENELDSNTLESYRIVMGWMDRIREVGDTGLLCDAWDLLGLCHYQFGRDLECNQAFETALGYAEETGDPERVCRVRKNLGVSLLQMNASHHALRCFLDALHLARLHGYVKLAAQIENNIASIHILNGNDEAAREIYERLLVHVEAYGLSPAIAHYNMTDVLLRLGELDAVASHIREGKRLAAVENRQVLLAGLSCFAGLLFRQRGHLKSARICLEKSVPLCRSMHLHEEGVRGSLAMVFLEQEAEDAKAVIHHCRETITYGKSVGMLEEATRAYECLVDGWKRLGDDNAAWEASREYGLFLMEREAHERMRTQVLMDMELDLLEHGRARRRLETELAIDPLTGLESHRMLEKRMQAVRQTLQGPSAVLFLDLDNLKEVNDRFGHAAGDHLIMAFSRLIRELLPEDGIATRKAGDEFVLYLPQTNGEEALQFAERFLMAASVERPVGEYVLPLCCSIGIALDPECRHGSSLLTDRADLAMLCAKRNGRMRVEFSCEPGEVQTDWKQAQQSVSAASTSRQEVRHGEPA